LSDEQLSGLTRNELLLRCAEIVLTYSNFSAGWIGRCVPETAEIAPLAFLQPGTGGKENQEVSRKLILLDGPLIESIQETAESGKPPQRVTYRSCTIWPFSHHDFVYGVVTIFSEHADGFPPDELKFLETTVADLSLTLYAHDVSVQLQFERDFNNEIIDSIQALMVSITPCGKILRFNAEAEKVTGHNQEDVLDSYWVDILLSPEHRLHYQNVISRLLKTNAGNLSFRASLRTKNGELRTIDWHSSIKPDIDQGSVGMVLFGLDITDRLAADQKYDSAVAKWENIFATIQDPALITTRDGIIIDANHATFSAARKSRDEVIGRSVCLILHGGRKEGSVCPLEDQIQSGESRILHTELSGLHGDYLLTVSPLADTVGSDEATLLVARDMTEEERHKAEALRAAQLASIGELAAGVAHEINNPINGILNYAQMLNDLAQDNRSEEVIGHINAEAKRIASIVRNLLDFSRHRVEEPEPVDGGALLDDCLELVQHQLLKDHVIIEKSMEKNLPLTFCNRSQVQQVFLNVISNSRYALNEKYRGHHPDKKLRFDISLVQHTNTPYVRFTMTDYGTGIEHHLINRVFDPFFSTKPNGEGTGLGLSISYGLIRDNGGYMRIKSLLNEYTAIIIDLPAAKNRRE
jgi:PAS domain S-box-containing protein